MRVLVFGDSITQGLWDTEGGWAARLRQYYDERQIEDLVNNDEPTVFNLGISGDLTVGVLKRFDHEVEARRWRWPNEEFTFIFAIGINDSGIDNGGERSNPAKYRHELEQLIAKAKKITDRILFIGLTPCEEEVVNKPWRYKALSNKRILEFDETLQEVCKRKKAAYLGVFDRMKADLDAGKHYYDDGLHPNDEGHKLIFELVRPELDKLLDT